MTQFTASSRPTIGLVQFPGSNCDADCIDTLKRHFGIDATLIWHTETSLPKIDAIVLPGGFSYGDYLRSGALASHSPVMAEVKSFVKKGGPVIGICNGFQVLTESHLLPGALLRNNHRKFLCKYVDLAVESGSSVYSKTLAGRKLSIPIAHGEGRFFASDDALKRMKDNGQIVFKYAGEDPNGSVEQIAGVCSENGRVLGLMPHPERATDMEMGGSSDGLGIWKSFFASFL